MPGPWDKYKETTPTSPGPWAKYAQPSQLTTTPIAAPETPPEEYGSTGFEHYQAPSVSQLAVGAAKSVPGLTGGLTGFEQGENSLSPEEMKVGMQAAKEPQNAAQQAGHTIGSVAQALPWGELAAAKAGPEFVNLVHKVLPSAMKADAGELFASVAKDANKVPVSLDNAGDAALKLMDWQRKTQLGPTINKFLNRITNGKMGPLTYEEARDYYSLLSKMSVDETTKLAGPVKYTLQKMTAGLKTDIGDAADQVGRAADYYKAMGDYAKAAKLQEWYALAKKYAIRAGLAAAGGGAIGAGAHFAKEGLGQ